MLALMILATLKISSFVMLSYNQNELIKKDFGHCSSTEYFRGSINDQTAIKIINKIESCRPNTIVFTSEGGDEEAAFLIVSTLKKHNVKLEIKEACFSACAQIIMLSMDSVKIRRLTIIGFHHSAYAINQWSSKYIKEYPEYRDIYEKSLVLAENTVRLIGDKKKLHLLRQSFKFVEPKCLMPGNLDSGGAWKIWMGRQFWFPSRADLERSGLVIDGDWENIPPALTGTSDIKALADDEPLGNAEDSMVTLLPHCQPK